MKSRRAVTAARPFANNKSSVNPFRKKNIPQSRGKAGEKNLLDAFLALKGGYQRSDGSLSSSRVLPLQKKRKKR